MEETHKLRAQIGSIVTTNFPGVDVGLTNKLKPPNDLQVDLHSYLSDLPRLTTPKLAQDFETASLLCVH